MYYLQKLAIHNDKDNGRSHDMCTLVQFPYITWKISTSILLTFVRES
jgi:hypothetical protein